MDKAIEITPSSALELIGKGSLLVDVREPDEVAEASFDVSGIIYIPFSTFAARYREIPAERDVIIGCKVGERSLMATCFLLNQGYGKAVNMLEGIVGWVENGLPVRGELKSKTCGCCCGHSRDHAVKSRASCC